MYTHGVLRKQRPVGCNCGALITCQVAPDVRFTTCIPRRDLSIDSGIVGFHSPAQTPGPYSVTCPHKYKANVTLKYT